LQLGFDTNSGQITATAGNPYLKPATAWQFDATVGDAVAGDVAGGDRLVEEVLHRLVEDVDRQLTDADVVLRLAASKVMTRPDFANIRNFLQLGFDTNSGQITAPPG
jgi:hypothetical protein